MGAEENSSSYENPAFEGDTAQISDDKKVIQDGKEEKRRIMKNVVIISISFVFLFTPLSSMASLQSSINKVDGTIALSTLYVALVLSCAFLPTWMIKKFKAKWTLCLSMLCYSSYIAAQFYPRLWTLVPTSIILGLGAAPMWSAKCTYLTQISRRYANIVGEDSEVTIVRFFGIFFLFFQTTQIIGNIFTSAVLSHGLEEPDEVDEEALMVCGVNYCPTAHVSSNTNVTNLDKPPMSKIYTMASILLVVSLLASAIVALFVDPLTRFGEDERSGSSTDKSTKQMLVATFNQMRHPYQLLAIPLTMWSGVEQAFLGADFTVAYITCGLGVHMVGYVMLVDGVFDCICSIGFSPLVSRFGRVPIFTLGAVLNLVVIGTLRYWMPHPDTLPVFFVMAGLWGIADAVWQTQINALYGILFPKESEAAFSNYRMWESLGYIFSFVLSSTSCISLKLHTVVASLVFGMICYYGIEVIERRGGLRKSEDGNALPIDYLVKDWLFGQSVTNAKSQKGEGKNDIKSK